MIEDEAVIGEMFGELGPLGSYGARVRLAYLLNMFGEKTLKDLNRIGRIRNRLAHRPHVSGIEHDEVKGQFDNITTLENLRKLEALAKEHLGDETFSPFEGLKMSKINLENPTYQFIFTVLWMSLQFRPVAQDGPKPPDRASLLLP